MGNLQRANFQKNKLYVGLGILVVVALLTIAVAPSILALVSDKSKETSTGNYVNVNKNDFSLEVDLGKRVFALGEKISFNATITNKSGYDVNLLSNGEMPCVFFHNINNNTTHGETTVGVYQLLKANGKISRVFEYEASDAGTYILDIHYSLRVNEVWIQDKIADIFIEVNS